MSADVDLLILGKEYKHHLELSEEGKDPSLKEETSPLLYRSNWIVTDFTDTAGLLMPAAETEGVEWRIEDEGRKFFFDALFGDGPKQFGLVSAKPVVFVDKHPRTGKLHKYSTRKYRNNRYLALRSSMIEYILEDKRKRNKNRAEERFVGFSGEDFFRILDRIPEDSTFWRGKTRAMTAFIRAFADPKECLVIPLIGIGIGHYNDHFSYCSIVYDYG